jgi:hypothetical protein
LRSSSLFTKAISVLPSVLLAFKICFLLGKSIISCHCKNKSLFTSSEESGASERVLVIPQQAEVAQVVPGGLRPLIFVTFGTTRAVGRQPYTPAGFTPGDIPGTHFQRLSRPQGTWFCRGEPRKKSLVTPPGVDPGIVRLVTQCLNHYATPGPLNESYSVKIYFNHSPFLDSFSWTNQCIL